MKQLCRIPPQGQQLQADKQLAGKSLIFCKCYGAATPEARGLASGMTCDCSVQPETFTKDYITLTTEAASHLPKRGEQVGVQRHTEGKGNETFTIHTHPAIIVRALALRATGKQPVLPRR